MKKLKIKYIASLILIFNALSWQAIACDPETTFPYTEEFEGTVEPACWNQDTNGSTYGWTSSTSGNSGNAAKFDSNNNPNGNIAIMNTVTFDLTNLTKPALSFYYKNPEGGDFTVLISSDGGANFTILETGLTGQSAYLQKTYDLTTHQSNSVVIQFKGTSNQASGDAYVYLDDVKILDIAPVPDATTLSDVTAECPITVLIAPTATDDEDGVIIGTHNATFPIIANRSITWTYTDSNGNSTIQYQNVVLNPINNSVLQNSHTLTAEASGYSYQWVKCTSGGGGPPGIEIIEGETNQSFTATTNGSYAVIISSSDCSLTSDCISVSTVSTLENVFNDGLNVYPNPFKNQIHISFGNTKYNIEIKVRNVLQQIVLIANYANVKDIELYTKLISGVYFIDITSDTGEREILKIIKK